MCLTLSEIESREPVWPVSNLFDHEGNLAFQSVNFRKLPVVMTVTVMSKRGESRCR